MTEQEKSLAELRATPEWQKLKEDFDKKRSGVARVFMDAVRVDCYRFNGYSRRAFEIVGHIQDLPHHAVETEQDKRFALRLGVLLLNPNNYLCPGVSMYGCEFEPAVEFRVYSETNFVSVIICFKCKQFMILENDPEVPMRSLGGQKGRFRICGDIDFIEGELYELRVEAFGTI